MERDMSIYILSNDLAVKVELSRIFNIVEMNLYKKAR